MPVDPSHNPQARRTARKSAADEEIDSRRARGEISCAECRRLKLKCDKRLPCSSCVRRGCPSICPNGSLSTGQGTRFVLADTTQLHTKIGEMGNRIRQLEDALAIFQSGVSTEPHPLLTEPLLSIKFGPEKSYVTEKENKPRKEAAEPLIDAFGTMTIGDTGEAKYFGPSAGSETLFLAGAQMENVHDDGISHDIPPEVTALSDVFPLGGEKIPENALRVLFSYLPAEPRAWSLCETFMEHASWAVRPVLRQELIEDYLTPTYRILKEQQESGSDDPELGVFTHHKLAVLYFAFALGALMDLTLEPYNKEASLYYHLAKGCLGLRSIFDSPDVATVQALLLLSTCHGMGGQRYTIDSGWALTALASKLGQSLGLHRDPLKWGLDPKSVQKRRALFWELASADYFYALAIGRPPSIRMSYVDCEFPEDEDVEYDEEGKPLMGYYRWKYEFTKEIFTEVVELTLTAKPPPYSAILELDHKIRQKHLPSHLNVFLGPTDGAPSAYMKACMHGQFRSITLLFVHRSFFAQAMLDHPSNPLQSPFAPSFLAAYRCASGIIKSSLNHYDRFPNLCKRWWGVWTHVFSAAIIVGSIVTRSPASSMAPTAFVELGVACLMFEKGATTSRRARSGLAVLHSIRDKAYEKYSKFKNGQDTSVPSSRKENLVSDGDELSLFGGQTRLLVTRIFDQSKRKAGSRTSTSTTSSPALAASPAFSPAATVSSAASPATVPISSASSPETGSSFTTDSTPSVGGQQDVFPSYAGFGTGFLKGGDPFYIEQPSELLPYFQTDHEMAYQNQMDSWATFQSQAMQLTTLTPPPFDQQTNELQYQTSPQVTAPVPDDFGMIEGGITGAGIDDQWTTFLRQCGIMDPTAMSLYSQNQDFTTNATLQHDLGY